MSVERTKLEKALDKARGMRFMRYSIGKSDIHLWFESQTKELVVVLEASPNDEK